MTTITASTLIGAALRKVSSYTPGQGIDGNELTDCLAELNRMLDSWSNDGFLAPFRTLESFAMVVGQASYTIGSGANFSTTRPDNIMSAFVRDSNNQDYYVTTDLTRDEYDAIPLKTTQGLPSTIYYDKQYANGVIYVYPTAQLAYTIYLDSEKPLTQISSSGTTISLPPGYYDAIVWNLAERLGPDYGMSPVPPEVSQHAAQSLALIRRANNKPAVSNFDPLLSVTPTGYVRNTNWNIYNG